MKKILDESKGQWVAVKKFKDVQDGQFIRYVYGDGDKCGYSDNDRRVLRLNDDGTFDTLINGESNAVGVYNFFKFFNNLVVVEAFIEFTLVNKTVKVYIDDCMNGKGFCFEVKFASKIDTMTCSGSYTLRSSAIRAAKRFCEDLGFKCEIVKAK